MKKNVVVIGAGLAGTLLGNELADKANVTLLEIGDKEVIGYPVVTFLTKRFAAVKTFCLGGGGTTNLWHNGLIPILSDDVIGDDFKEVITEASLFSDKAAANIFWQDNPYSAEYEKSIKEANEHAAKIGMFADGVDCLLYPKKFSKVEPAAAVSDHYAVRDIEFSTDDTRVTTVRYRVGGDEMSVAADAVVISAGTLGSPLLVKKVLSALHCPVDSVGAGLADHPLGFVGKVKVKKTVNQDVRALSLRDKGKYEYRTAIRVKSECGQFTGCAFLRPALTMSNNLPVYKFKSLLGASSGKDRFRNMFSWKLFHPDILAEIYSHVFGAAIPGRIYNILFLFEQKRGNSRVSYDGSDLVVDWSITSNELDIYRGMIKKLHSILAGSSDEINLETDITEDWLWSAAHHSGTISLGTKEGDLVDKNLKLNGVDNVFVCDGSVIQEHSYANTGLTIGSLAMRLAQRILL